MTFSQHVWSAKILSRCWSRPCRVTREPIAEPRLARATNLDTELADLQLKSFNKERCTHGLSEIWSGLGRPKKEPEGLRAECVLE